MGVQVSNSLWLQSPPPPPPPTSSGTPDFLSICFLGTACLIFLFLSNPISPHEVLNRSLGSNWTQEKQAINKMRWRSIYCFAYVQAKLSCNKINSPMGWALWCQALAAPSRFLKSKHAFCFLICSLPAVNFCLFLSVWKGYNLFTNNI